MSNFISEPTELDSEPTVKNKLRKITFHPSNFNSVQLRKWDKEAQERQNLFLKNICKKFAVHQQQVIREKSSEEVIHQLKDLKHRLRHSLQKQNIQKIMSENGASKKQNYLDKVLREKTEMVDIGKKYSKKIHMKLTLFNEADEIVGQKGSYKQWYNNNRNSFANSPIYHKISQIIDKKDTIKEIFPNTSKNFLRNTMDQQILTYNQSTYIRKKRSFEAKPQPKRVKYIQ